MPCGDVLGAIWYLRVRRRENIFRKNHYYGTKGGVCTFLTHGHTNFAHISHIFREAEPPAPCQTGLPCTRSHTRTSILRAPNSNVKTTYPVITFAQLTAGPPPPRTSPSVPFLPTLQPVDRATSRHLWRSVVCFPLSLRSPSAAPSCGHRGGKSGRRYGLPSADRGNKATLPLTGPFRTAKSSAKDLTPLVPKLQYAKYHNILLVLWKNRLLRR